MLSLVKLSLISILKISVYLPTIKETSLGIQEYGNQLNANDKRDKKNLKKLFSFKIYFEYTKFDYL